MAPLYLNAVETGASADLQTLLTEALGVLLHCPLTNETRGLINRERLGWMRPGAILVNTARTDLIVEADLIEALKENRISVGLDCFEIEPLPPSSSLLTAQYPAHWRDDDGFVSGDGGWRRGKCLEGAPRQLTTCEASF